MADCVFKGKSVVGTWLGNLDDVKDVHIYVDNDKKRTVLGYNLSYNDDIDFSDVALCFSENEIQLQYADEEGNVQHRLLDEEVVTQALFEFLERAKRHVVGIDV